MFHCCGKMSCLLPEGEGDRRSPAGVPALPGFWEGDSSQAVSGTGAQHSAVWGCPWTVTHSPAWGHTKECRYLSTQSCSNTLEIISGASAILCQVLNHPPAMFALGMQEW